MANQVFNARVDLLSSTQPDPIIAPDIFLVEFNIYDGTGQFGSGSIQVGDILYLDTYAINATISKYKVTEVLGASGLYFTGKIQYIDTGDICDPANFIQDKVGYICRPSLIRKFAWHSAPAIHTFADQITQYARDQEVWELIDGISVTGPQGIQGSTGLGLQGETGVAGAAGSAGSAGLQGETGVAGVAGSAGLQGETGVAGAAGSAGLQGVTGIAGSAGLQGVTGVAGSAGLQGVTGVGAAGLQGVTGAGLQGVTGIGSQGETGVGSQGVTGFQGVTGAGGSVPIIKTLTYYTGLVAIRAYGPLSDLNNITVTKDTTSVAGTTRCILGGIAAGVEILEVHCTMTAAETVGRTQLNIELPDPTGSTNMTTSFRPYLAKWTSSYGFANAIGSCANVAGILIVAATGMTQSAEQKVSMWV